MFENPKTENASKFMDFCNKFGFKFYVVEADHCYQAYSGVLLNKDWKILYSGDTKPSINLINHGIEATLLIHEATNDDTNPESTAEHYHTTTS